MIEGNGHHPDFTDQPATSYIGPERRGKARLYWCCAAMVRGVERGGGRFEINAVIEDISASGLYIRLSKSVEPGAALFLTMRFTNPSAAGARGPLISIQGRVLRVEEHPDGEFGVALAIEQHEFV